MKKRMTRTARMLSKGGTAGGPKPKPKGGMKGGGTAPQGKPPKPPRPKMNSKMQSKMMPGMKPGGATNDKLEMVARGDKMVPKYAVDGKGPNDLGMAPGGRIKTMKKMYTGGTTSKTAPKGGGPKG